MTETMREVAELYAIGSISEEDVVWLLKKYNEPYKSFEELPKEFHDYVEEYYMGYELYLEQKEQEELAKRTL